jgi:hypothetical protein
MAFTYLEFTIQTATSHVFIRCIANYLGTTGFNIPHISETVTNYGSEISGSQGGDDVDVNLLDCDAVWTRKYMETACFSEMLVSTYMYTRRLN